MKASNFGQRVSQSQLGRIVLLGILILLLQIPITSIEHLVQERGISQYEAVADVQQKWGQAQHIIGPMLVIPYRAKKQWQDNKTGGKKIKSVTKRAVFLPDELSSTSQLVNERRYRGIFEVPLYQAEIGLQGHFSQPSFDKWDIKNEDVLWDKARLVIMVSDARAIQKQAKIVWNQQSYFLEPGSDAVVSNAPGYHIDLPTLAVKSDQYAFKLQLKLNGSGSLYFAPLGKNSLIEINAPWPDPSFQGNWLPTSREVNQEGFSSQWQIPYLGRNFPQQIQNFSTHLKNIQQALVGVDLISPVDNYRMFERSLKYQMLFFVLTFVAIWLIELLSKLRVHIMQYLFIGAGLCIFYLLALSLSEHLGFYIAYFIATAAIVALVSFYSYVVLGTGRRALTIGASLAALYAYLFSLLQEQNYALLIGSIGVFTMLAVVMYLTRHIDWFKLTPLSSAENEAYGVRITKDNQDTHKI